jgi:hypothetical protein
MESELGGGPVICFNKPVGDSGAWSNLSTGEVEGSKNCAESQ